MAEIESAIGAGGVRGPAGQLRDLGKAPRERPAIGCDDGQEIPSRSGRDSSSIVVEAGKAAGSMSQEVSGDHLGLGKEDRRLVEFRSARTPAGSCESAWAWKRGCDVEPAP